MVTNDDGITSGGIRALIDAVKELGDVVVVAPDKPQSAMGHAITINRPLRLARVDIFEGVQAFSCSGTPVDCVKLAVDKVLHRRPDLCVSGINHGSNSSINIMYSGTLSAAMEAAMEGIPAIGFSLLDYGSRADMTTARYVANKVAKQMLEVGLTKNHLLNVNIPKLPLNELKGMKFCRQAKAKWVEDFDERTDPFGRRYYWLTGKFVNMDEGDDTDEAALKDGYVSIVPVQYDLTAYDDIGFLEEKWVL